MIPIYSDTDSIYASLDSPSFSQDKFDQYVKPLLHDTKLGAFKLEMDDDVGEDEAEGIFLACKLYALRGPNTGVEMCKGKGIPEWLLKNEEKHIKRR
jgi:hypothetical protein